MTVIDLKTATYLVGVGNAIREGRVPEKYLTDMCPECGLLCTWSLGEDPHITMPAKEYDTISARSDANDWQVYVVVGCEGYWAINPRDVGMPSESWQDWTLLPNDVTPDDFT